MFRVANTNRISMNECIKEGLSKGNMDYLCQKLIAQEKHRTFGKNLMNIKNVIKNENFQLKASKLMVTENVKNNPKKNVFYEDNKENIIDNLPNHLTRNTLKEYEKTSVYTLDKMMIDFLVSQMDLNKKKNQLELKNYNPQDCFEYQSEILQEFRDLENSFRCNANYMELQDDINDKMRAILIDWLIEVFYKFKLLPETLFLTVNIIDRYLSQIKIMRSKLQLVGITALFIALKYEEIYPPDLSKLVYITDKAYTKKEVLDKEIDIMRVLNFDVTVPSPLRYYDFIHIKFNLSDVERDKCLYLLFVALIDGKLKRFSYFILACAAASIVCPHLKYQIFDFYGKKDKFFDIQDCINQLTKFVNQSNANYLCSVNKIFENTKYHSASLMTYQSC